uniref:Ribosomal protein S14 n=1 Tax=Imasa heleensis TaxID=2772037 RepID=A0A893DDG2_9EUKA|nr:ribosomal protein S14 [Imasa heleensis]QRR29753.1 ribosomal protein S14 [Imasa heleensis]
MKYIISKDNIKRRRFKSKELNCLLYKYIIQNLNIESNIRNFSMFKLMKANNKSSITMLNNRCTLTGTSKSVSREFGISRVKLRELSLAGCVTGVVKSTW